MRIDNFVYTRESFREARHHLNPNGVLFLKFAVDRPWMGRRLFPDAAADFWQASARFLCGLQLHARGSVFCNFCFGAERRGHRPGS